jgi:hypothetical protein
MQRATSFTQTSASHRSRVYLDVSLMLRGVANAILSYYATRHFRL